MIWPEEIVSAIAHRKSVLFLGAGISASAKNAQGINPPTWKEFLNDLIEKYNNQLVNYIDELNRLLLEKNYLMACEIVVDSIGETKFEEYVADRFRRPAFEPNELHELIFSLDSRIVVTPNVDKIYERYAMAKSKGTIVSKSYKDSDVAKYLRTDDYLIIKSHGSSDEAQSLIFTHKQYAEARCKYGAFYQLLDALILTHTFVFLGCGINDPDIELLLENSNFNHPYCKPHYFISPKGEISEGMKKSIEKNRNLEIIEYENEDGTHTNFRIALESLVQDVEGERQRMFEFVSK